MNPGHQIGALVEFPAAEAPGEGVDDPQRQGKGSHVEEVVRICQQQAVDVALGQVFQVAAQSQNPGGVEPADFRPAAAVGCQIAYRPLSQRGTGRDPELAAQQTQNHPQHNADKADEHPGFTPQVSAEGDLLNQPGRDDAHQNQNDGQQNLQNGGGGEVHSHAHAADGLCHAEDGPEDLHAAAAGFAQVPLSGDHGEYLAAQLLIAAAGGIHHPAAPKEHFVDLDLKGTALVAHLHPLVDGDPSAVQLENHIAQLCPVENHHGQVGSCQGQLTAHLSGGDALRRGDASGADEGQGVQKQQPVHQPGTCHCQHGGQLGVALPDVGLDGGEHLLGNHHGHGETLVVVESLGGAAGDHFLIHIVGQGGFNAGLLVDAGEGGHIFDIVRQGDDKFHLLHGIGEAAQHGDIQLQIVAAAGGGLLGGDGLGDIVSQGDIHFPGHAAHHPGDIHIDGGGAFGGACAAAVDGNIGGIGRHREGQALHRSFQPEPQGQAHHAVAVGVDGDEGLHRGCGAFGGGGHDKKRRHQHTAQGQANQSQLQADSSFLKNGQIFKHTFTVYPSTKGQRLQGRIPRSKGTP